LPVVDENDVDSQNEYNINVYLFKSGSKVHKTHKTAWTHTMKTRQKETLKLNTAQQIDNIKIK